MRRVAPVVVVGAGIGGLSTALALQRLGRDCVVLEQAPRLGEVGAGIGLWPGAIRSLERLGLADRVAALRRCPFREAETVDPAGRRLVRFPLADVMAGTPGFVTRRSDLHRLLADGVAPGTVVTGALVTGLRPDGDSVLVEVEGGVPLRASIVVGADGLRSTVRRLVAGDSPPRYSGETCYRGMADLAVDDPGMLREVQGRGLRAAVHPVDETHVYWWAARRLPPGVEESACERKDAVTRLFGCWPYGVAEAVAATPAEVILKNDLYDRPPLRPWSRGRVTLLGDAAHPTTPNLGLGGCMAIEDAVVLARALDERRGDHAAAFAQYERERRARTSRVVRTSAMFGRLGGVRAPAAVAARNAVMRLTPTPLLAWQFGREVGYDPGPPRRYGA